MNLSLNIDAKILELIASKKNNGIMQVLMVYKNMVHRLFMFIEASRNRDWLHHLHAAKELMQDFLSMDRIKYRRMWAVYIADMIKLETDEPDVWETFMQGNFSCQKNKIPGTALGRDHAGEQVNKILKICGGITAKTSKENSCNRHFLVAPILESISEEMLKAGGGSYLETKTHHELKP